MATGEGKTLTAGLAACVAGVAGMPVHVVTVNDYLAERDAATLGPLYAFAGLRVGVVHHGIEPAERRLAYACDVTYCTNKELVFDYLRDRVAAGGRASAAQLRSRQLYDGAALQPPLLRGLHFAIVDECDSILVDEARTPLILAVKAGPVDHAAALPQALRIAGGLERGLHWSLNAARREIRLTDAGRAQATTACQDLGVPWPAAHVREHLVVQALCALHLYRRDHQYLVDADGKVQIIDEYTGRVLPGRTWEQGLHQMIETKEGVPLSEQTRTLARITYQRFFCRYLRLAGMTGTARELAHELSVVYRLETVVVPTHRPVVRTVLKARLCADAASKWQAVAAFAAQRQAAGQPVLVGTRSVEASEELSAVLASRAVEHQVLNARQDAEEAAIVAAAGRRGAVTVATNMAGRGTDIALGEGAAGLGGLCVVLTEFHESPRIDRQLFGRGRARGPRMRCRDRGARRRAVRPAWRRRLQAAALGAADASRADGVLDRRRARGGTASRGAHARPHPARHLAAGSATRQDDVHFRGPDMNRTLISLLTLALPWSAWAEMAAPAGGPKPGSGGYACLIEPMQRIELRSPVEGRIAAIHAERGAEVRKGQILVELDTASERAALEGARFRAHMQGQIRSADSRLSAAKEKFQRRDELLKEKFIANQDRDDALAELNQADAAAAEARDNQRLAALEQQRLAELVEQRRLRSPVNGIVTERLQGVGEIAQAGDGARPVLRLAQTQPLRVEVVLPVAMLGKVKVGSTGIVEPEPPLGGRHVATVTIVDRVVDSASGTFGVRLELNNPKGSITAGVKCRTRFE
ncbi:efflux RND transporter periplasmic adaptor subunit [Ramlibacter montanisoli]|nr:efflux RND transporter periplasmic adaptor subunit [Ramlibacter montanisoli]